MAKAKLEARARASTLVADEIFSPPFQPLPPIPSTNLSVPLSPRPSRTRSPTSPCPSPAGPVHTRTHLQGAACLDGQLEHSHLPAHLPPHSHWAFGVLGSQLMSVSGLVGGHVRAASHD